MSSMATGPSRNEVPAWYSRLGAHADPELYADLAASIRPDALREWFFEPNEAFGGLSPAKLVEAGDLEPLRRAAYRLGSGEPSA